MHRYAVQRESVQQAKAARSTKDAEIFSSDPMAHTLETVTTTGAFWKLRKGYAGPDFMSNSRQARIAEAVERENMRFVPIKTEDQFDLQAVHRVRDRLVARRTSVINQIRAFLLERDLSFRKGPSSLRRQMSDILENAEE